MTDVGDEVCVTVGGTVVVVGNAVASVQAVMIIDARMNWKIRRITKFPLKMNTPY
jgi:hypothetical protein